MPHFDTYCTRYDLPHEFHVLKHLFADAVERERVIAAWAQAVDRKLSIGRASRRPNKLIRVAQRLILRYEHHPCALAAFHRSGRSARTGPVHDLQRQRRGPKLSPPLWISLVPSPNPPQLQFLRRAPSQDALP